MVDKDFIEGLFEKHKISSEEDKERMWKLLEDVGQEHNAEKAITSFTNKIDLAEQIICPKGIYCESDKGDLTAKQVQAIIPLYYDNSGIWWKWNYANKKWMIIDEVDLMNMVYNSSPANTINSKERGEIIQALKQVARRNRPEDPPKTLIQFGDEVVDILTGERSEASSQLFLTNPVPYKLGKSEETPTIDRIFTEWVGEDYVLLLKEIVAYCILRDYPIHRIFCFIGSGLNGKSCFLNFLRNFVGEDNCCSTELDTLISSRFEITRLHKKLVCQMGETNFNEMNKTSQLKKLSGGDLIGFEYKNKKPFEDINFAKILIATNNLPTTTDKTAGFYRRWVIIDFPNTFSEKKDILSEIPEKEYENFALQLVGILISLLKKREFHNEGSIEERMKRYEDHSNPLEKFWKDNIEEKFDDYIFKHEFKKRLEDWCKENRFRAISEKTIANFMKEKGIDGVKREAEWYNEKGKRPWLRAWLGVGFK